jgi:hypothetical protein
MLVTFFSGIIQEGDEKNFFLIAVGSEPKYGLGRGWGCVGQGLSLVSATLADLAWS